MTQDLKPEQEQIVTIGDENLKRLTDWLRQNSVLIVAVGWSMAFLCFTLPFSRELPGVIAGLGGLIAGAATALAIYVEAKPWRASPLLLIPIGLFATQWLQEAFLQSMQNSHIEGGGVLIYAVWFMLACAGPVLISLIIHACVPGIQKMSILVMTWAPLTVIGSAVAMVMEDLVAAAVIGLGVGALGGSVMVNRIAEARLSAKGTQ